MLANGIKETTDTTGTGTVTLAAIAGSVRFANGFATGSRASYAIKDGNNWEWGIGTVGAGNTLARTTITATLVAGTYTTTGAVAITLASGAADVICTQHTGTAAGFNAGTFIIPAFRPEFAALMEWNPAGESSTSAPGVKGWFLSTTGTLTGRPFDTTIAARQIQRIGYVSSAVAGSLAKWAAETPRKVYGGGAGGGGGFLTSILFVVSDEAAVAGARQFVGMRNSTAAANVEPSTLTQCLGVGNGAADTTLSIYYGGLYSQTPIPLGENFPANTLSTAGYQLILYAPHDPVAAGFRVGWYIRRLGTAFSASGTISDNGAGEVLPLTTTPQYISNWRTNNATALAVGLDIGSVTSSRVDGPTI